MLLAASFPHFHELYGRIFTFSIQKYYVIYLYKMEQQQKMGFSGEWVWKSIILNGREAYIRSHYVIN